MGKVLWSDISIGDHVELNGRDWRVEKVKPKGKRVKVTVKSGTHVATSEVKASAPVKKLSQFIGPGGKRAEVGPLRNAENGQARWATEAEHRKTLPAGDASVTKRPAKPSGDVWELPRDRVERKLDDILSARLVAEGDEKVGYYVPLPDVTTVASHLALFHPNVYDAEKDEATMLAGHEHAHRAALEGRAKLDVNHWHTKTRPAR